MQFIFAGEISDERPCSDLFLSVELSLTWSFSSWHQHDGETFDMPWILTDPVLHIPYSVGEVCSMRTVPRMGHAQFSNGCILMIFVAMLGYFSGGDVSCCCCFRLP